MSNTLSPAAKAALNIVLSSIERRTDRPWQFKERDIAVKYLSAMKPFKLSEAAEVAWRLTGKVIREAGVDPKGDALRMLPE